MTVIDAVAGYVHLAGLLGEVSVWWIELALAPAALLSVPVLIGCARNWANVPESAPVAATNGDS